MFVLAYYQADVVILEDVSGSMLPAQSDRNRLLDGLLSGLIIRDDAVKLAYHRIYGHGGWSLSSPSASTSYSSATTLLQAVDSSPGGLIVSCTGSTFDEVLTNLIQPGDRPNAPNFVFVIGDGACVPNVMALAASAR